MIDFKPGDHVVCLFEDWRFIGGEPKTRFPRIGEVYTVTGMGEVQGIIGVSLAEFCFAKPSVMYWQAEKFRKVEDDEKFDFRTIMKERQREDA